MMATDKTMTKKSKEEAIHHRTIIFIEFKKNIKKTKKKSIQKKNCIFAI
jgi:hypothetical protein